MAEIVKGKLLARIKRTPTIESFRFILAKKIHFIPGQFVQVLFDEKDSNNRMLNKYLSFSSSPTKEYIEVTKRLSESDFSGKLRSLQPQSEVLFKLPLGNCILKEEYKRIGFLIGGIGITPVISMIEYSVEKCLETDIVLCYSNRREEEIAFRKELDQWSALSSNINIIYTVTDCEPQDMRCISGHINKELIQKKMKDYNERIFFIFGPPRMVEAMQNVCKDIGCEKENIKSESFIGY
ncbi:MAG: FAD-dependent oxidoreductase [Candidatus Omnitrophota bacterium]|nr:MAG: FAD-dependent oxidoreductase [Candidatus Omnitrophota bacterium]